MEYNYGETFELMQAYSKLGKREQKIIEHLMTMQVYEGTYSELGRELNLLRQNSKNHLHSSDIKKKEIVEYYKKMEE